MTRFEQELREVCSLAESKKITDKKKCIAKVKELYERPAVLEELHANSRSKKGKGTNWTAIMHSVHNVLLHIVDKSRHADDTRASVSTSKLLRTKENRDSENRISYSMTMLDTVKKANSSEVFLSCNDLVSLVLQILSDEKYVDYHKIYATILVDHVLIVRQYQIEMLSVHWKECLNIFVAFYDNRHAYIDKHVLLDAIYEIIQHGCKQSHLALHLWKILPFLVKVLADAKNGPRNLSGITFKTVNAVCQAIGPENRVVLCEFGENVLRHAIDLNGDSAKYDWILLIVRAHHPGGVTRDHDASYACDWEKWTDILRLIYCMVINDCKSDSASESFVQLACEVSWQLKDDQTCIDDNINLDESCYEQPAKRSRTVIGIQGMIDVLTVEPLKESKLSLRILSALLKRYPKSINESSFLPLMEYLIGYLNTCRDQEIMDELWRFGKVMVQFEGKMSNTLVENNGIKLTWEKLWTVTLRSASTNKNVEGVHGLLQSLLSRKKVIDSNAFLNLYLKDTVPWSEYSIRTLLTFCKHNTIPDALQTSSNDQLPATERLLKWVLAIPQDKWNAQFPIDEVCELSVGLTLKSWYNTDQTHVSNVSDQFEIEDLLRHKNSQLELTSIENIHLLTAFETNLCREAEIHNIQHCKTVKHNFLYRKANLDLLVRDLVEKNIVLADVTYSLIVQTAVMAKILSNLKQLNIATGNIEQTLSTVIEKSMEEILLSTETIVKSKKRLRGHNLTNFLEALHLFYRTSYNNDVVDLIRSSTDPKLLKSILELTYVEELCETDGEIRMSDSHATAGYIKKDDLSERHRLYKLKDDFQKPDSVSDVNSTRMKACSILATFCSMVNGGVMSAMQENLQTAILNPDNYDLTQIFDFKMAITILESLTDCQASSFSGNIIDRSLLLLQKLCRQWHKDAEAARNILEILSKLFARLASVGTVVQRQNSLRLLQKFHELLQERKYGPTVHETFIQCLQTVARIDPTFTWTRWQDASDEGNETPVIEVLLVYIQSAFHIVRMKAINCLHVLFSSKDVALDWLKKFYSELSTLTSSSLFIFKGELNDKIKEDLRRNRIASALQIMAVVISCNAIFRSEALLSMFQLTVDKNVKPNIVKKVLERIGNSLQIKDTNYLVENNLNYLLTNWLEKKYSLDNFPAILIHCSSDQQFYQKYINIVVPILIRLGNLSGAQELCDKFQMSFKDVIENCFPNLIAWILLCVSADVHAPSDEINFNDIKRAMEVFNNLKLRQNEFKNVSEISVLTEKNLESVLLAVIKRLHDEEHSMQFLTILVNYPLSDPPHFKHADIIRGFKYLEDNIIGSGQSLLNILATKKQNVLQKVLLNLKSSIHEVNSLEHRLKALHHYVYFSMMISEQIDKDYFDEMSPYVVREICYTLIHFVKESVDAVSQAACSYLYHLLQRILPSRRTEIKQHLRFIVSSLIPIVKTGKTTHAYDILEFLVVRKPDVLRDAIEKLDSFPTDEVFRELREIQCRLKDKIGKQQNLESEIKHFLYTRGENSEYCSFTELEYLEKQLSTKKTELKEIYRKLGSTHRFSEDCASSVLHQLICALVKLTSSADPQISLRAAKCLGELGPADLSTMILQPERDLSKQLENPMLLFTYRVLVLLSNLLIHSDVRLFTSTSQALYIIMASCCGQIINKKRDELKSLIESSEEFLKFEYVKPFVTRATQSKDGTTIDKAKFDECVNKNEELWIGKVNGSHGDWVTNIVCEILDCFRGSYLNHLIPVCRANVSFCEKLLPWIVHLIFDTEKKLNIKIYSNINCFFDHHFNNIDEFKNSVTPSRMQKTTCFNHESVQCMLNVVDFVRSQSTDNCKLELNYLRIAKAAQYCSAYFTSVLYAELWCEKFLGGCPTTDVLTAIEYICEIEPEDGKVLQEILREAYIKIGDPDAIYGCGTSYFQNLSATMEHYVQLRKWDKVLLAHDIELSLGNKTATKGLRDALQHSGLQYLLGAFAKTIDKEDEDKDSNYRYECAWRLSDWNLPATQQTINLEQDIVFGFQNIASNDYPLFHYHALKSFHEFDTQGLKSALESARVSIVKTLRSISLESCKTIYPTLSQLQMLREIEEVYFAKPETYESIIQKWNDQDSMVVNDFEYVEPILSQRSILLQARVADGSKVIENALADTYLRLTESSKKHGYFQMAARALGSLAKRVRLSADVTAILRYEEANLAWMRGDQEIGRHLLRNLIVSGSANSDIHSQALRVYGNWMAETKSENPQKVIQKYYLPSLEYSKKIKNPTQNDKKNLLDTRAALAQFADVQYQQILTYMKSPQFESFKECVAYSEEAIGKLSEVSKDCDERRAACINKRQSSNDMAELENIEREKNMYLLLALEHYILTLQHGDDHNLLIFRLVSLWLDNTHHEDLNKLFETNLDKLPSYKFVLLVPQLAPHMTDTNDVFSTQIYRLLKRCAIEHPHHTLPVLLSLKNLHKDHEFYKSKKQPTVEPRVLGARKLIENLLKTEVKLIIQEMDRLAYSLIMLANQETPKMQSKKITVPNNSRSIVHIKNFQYSSVPTLSIDIKPSKVYDRVISVHQYKNTFELVGGVNAPKKVTCIGTDGVKRNQLVKGKDDLRQDAVMQQVFTVMNLLLKNSKETNRRKLNVRTYKVVPLTQRCGILEWCDDTMPIGVILEGSSGHVGLHAKYYPHDYPSTKCRKLMQEVAKNTNDEKRRRFLDCCKHLHPVFHYFFLESFSSPEIWFERRLAYMHSVATTSIIGYILGLGDRHVNNILVDKSTAEVIHIDFGIAFEQGKVLPTPETVPFRLTRDIEAAMGVSGVEGVFRRSCEETMTVLRCHREVIITLLQVLLYDPLFSWAITPAKAYSLQKGQLQGSSEHREAFGETNKFAERALLRLDQKLRGTEEGSASSVAGQVEKLIQEARDPDNLSRLYCGWQAYL